MAAIAFTAPILPGKAEAFKRFSQEMLGPHRREYEASRQRKGVRVERAYLQQTPQGDIAILYCEVDDPAHFFQELGTSNDPFDRWFRQQALDIHGIDLGGPLPAPLPEQTHEWQA
jgi:hypothetical protein